MEPSSSPWQVGMRLYESGAGTTLNTLHKAWIEGPTACVRAAYPGLQERGGQDVGAAAGELAPEVPAIHAALTAVARAAHNVCVPLCLLCYEVRDVLGLHSRAHESACQHIKRMECLGSSYALPSRASTQNPVHQELLALVPQQLAWNCLFTMPGGITELPIRPE